MEYDIFIKVTKLVRGKGLCEQLVGSAENSKEEEKQVETVLNNEEQPIFPAVSVTWNQQIIHYLQIGGCLEDLDRLKRRYFKLQAISYALVDGILFKKDYNNILLRCIEPDQIEIVLKEFHEGPARGHFAARTIALKIMRAVFSLISASSTFLFLVFSFSSVLLQFSISAALIVSKVIFRAIVPNHLNYKANGANSKLFREYIGAEFDNVKFSDLPIDPGTEFHFILAFAIDYTPSGSAPRNGKFNIFWDSDNLSPRAVQAIKAQHENVKVAVSLGGDSVSSGNVQFRPSSVSSWVSNAVSSLTDIIQQYHLDGIDIDYEHFDYSDPNTFAECIGQLITLLKQNNVISFASIAPYDDGPIQSHYTALWKSYSDSIDYVNFQFYAYDSSTSVSQFMNYFNAQESRYSGGKVLASFMTEGSGGLSPANGFFDACRNLRDSGKLHGIFVWCADSSQSNDFQYEKQSQSVLLGS
ncbi:chitinase 2-like [Cryptomeria japonica]|uniref:chitinase 2-like n=1 Tax=Cryptomeria japonica TaxID=3369 RepID=UPI0025AC7D6D|nr:chitinase 2-like [Cryptomeria japonica]